MFWELLFFVILYIQEHEMSTAELKSSLISQIKNITDKARLEELLKLVVFQGEEATYVTSQEEKDAISEARKQIENGDVLANSKVQNEIGQWLSK